MPKSAFKASEKLGNVVRKERTMLNMTQEELSAAIDHWINADSISLIEKGKQGLSNGTAERLMHLFECDAQYLRGTSECKSEKERQEKRRIEAINAQMQERRRSFNREKSFNRYMQFFLEECLGWRFVALAGVLIDKNDPTNCPPVKHVLGMMGEYTVPREKDFVSQFSIYKDASDELHFLSNVQLDSLQDMIIALTESAVISMENSVPCPIGWDDCSNGRTMERQSILNFLNEKGR